MAIKKADIMSGVKELTQEIANLRCQVEMLSDEAQEFRHEMLMGGEVRRMIVQIATRIESGESDTVAGLRTRVKVLEREKELLVGHLRKHGIDDYPMNEWEVENEDSQ